MPKYKRVDTANGRVMYWVDGVMSAHSNVPDAVKNILEDGVEIEIGENDPAPIERTPFSQQLADIAKEYGEDTDIEKVGDHLFKFVKQTVDASTPNEGKLEQSDNAHVCFIDGDEGTFKKFLQLKTVYLCEEHHKTLTTGQIVAEMRERDLL